MEDTDRVEDVLDAHESAGMIGEPELRAVRHVVAGQREERHVSATHNIQYSSFQHYEQ